jgi:hypothetical protein
VCRDFCAQLPTLASHIAAILESWHELRRKNLLGVSERRHPLGEGLYDDLCAWVANVRARLAQLLETLGRLGNALRLRAVWGREFEMEVWEHCYFVREYGFQTKYFVQRLEEEVTPRTDDPRFVVRPLMQV